MKSRRKKERKKERKKGRKKKELWAKIERKKAKQNRKR